MEALSAGGKVRVETVVLQDGEQFKSMEELGKVFDAALTARLDRQVPPYTHLPCVKQGKTAS